MANIDLYKQKLVAIADAIRTQLSEQDTYKLEQMPNKILSIQTGGHSIEIKEGYTNKTVVPKNISYTIYNMFNTITVATGYEVITVEKE